MGFLSLALLPLGQIRGMSVGMVWQIKQEPQHAQISCYSLDVPFLCLGVPCQTSWDRGRALRESLGEEQECCSCSPGARGGSRNHSRNEVWGEVSSTWKDLEETQTARVTGSAVTERRAASLLHAKANPWKTGWELPRYTHYQRWKIFLLLFSGVSYCLSMGKLRMRAGAAETPRILKPFCWSALVAHPQPLPCPNPMLSSCSSLQVTQIIITNFWAKSKLFHEFSTPREQWQSQYHGSHWECPH